MSSEGLREALNQSPVPLAKWEPNGKAAHLSADDLDWIAEHLTRAALEAAPPGDTLDVEKLEQAVIDSLAQLGYTLIDEASGLHGTEPAFAAELAARLRGE